MGARKRVFRINPISGKFDYFTKESSEQSAGSGSVPYNQNFTSALAISSVVFVFEDRSDSKGVETFTLSMDALLNGDNVFTASSLNGWTVLTRASAVVGSGTTPFEIIVSWKSIGSTVVFMVEEVAGGQRNTRGQINRFTVNFT